MLGLQKVYLRRIMYLHEDGKSMLGQLMEPFKQEVARELKKEMKLEEQPEKVSKRKKKDGVGHHATNYKLDLKNSAWWKAGFDNAYLQE